MAETICEIEGFVQPEEKPKKKLTREQLKIKELREIVNQKDKIMDDLVLIHRRPSGCSLVLLPMVLSRSPHGDARPDAG